MQAFNYFTVFSRLQKDNAPIRYVSGSDPKSVFISSFRGGMKKLEDNLLFLKILICDL